MDVSYKPGKQQQIARLLLDGSKTLTDLAKEVDGDTSGLLRLLRRMQGKNLVAFERSTTTRAGRGRSAGLWSLPDDRRDEVTAIAQEEVETAASIEGSLQRSQRWVLASVATRRIPDLMEILAEAEALAGAAWIAELQGDAHSYLVIFDDEVGRQPADNLVAMLQDGDLRCTSGSVAAIDTPERLRSNAAGVRAARRRAAQRRGDRGRRNG